ncbi:NADP-dependent oxidoreductase [Actinomadura viridis]|uniref:NADP-dependent oxidoreductase n=1 Tax=Actinomadura viridis TaxID=58110 RepID=UPI003683A220
MRSVIIREHGGPEVVSVSDVPVPAAGSQQVRVRVGASSLNPIDVSARAGRLVRAGLMEAGTPFGLGWDVVGVVDAVAPDVSRVKIGDRVIGLRDLLFSGGAHAEFVVLHESAVAPAPASLPDELAATLPLNALTADRAVRLTGLDGGGTLLVTGAGGAVGGYAVELARRIGIRTIALGRPRDLAHLEALGADHVLTDARDLGNRTRGLVPAGVDAVIDAAVLGIGAHTALRGGGTFVALVAPFAPPPIRATTVVVQEVYADGARLGELAELAGAGHLTPRVAEVLPLAEARKAHELYERGGHRGRIVLAP